MEAAAGDGAAEKEPAEGDALAALLSQAQALTGLIEEKTAAGAEQVGGMFEGFFDEASDQDDLVDQVLQQKDETLRTLYEENEELKAQMAEYEQTVEVMMQRNSAQKEQLAAERATQQQLRDENAALVRRLQARPFHSSPRAPSPPRTHDTRPVAAGARWISPADRGAGFSAQEAANVIRTTGPTAAAGSEGEGDATAAAGEENELLQKLLSDVAEVTAKNVPGAPDSTQRLEEAAELCEQGHRLFSEELVQVRLRYMPCGWVELGRDRGSDRGSGSASGSGLRLWLRPLVSDTAWAACRSLWRRTRKR